MAAGSTAQTRRHRVWVVAVFAGLLVIPPGAGVAQQSGGEGTVAQLDPSAREPICQVLRSVRAAVAQLPGAAQLVDSLLQSFGCTGTAPGTTTTSVGGTTTTTTLVLPTTSTIGPGTSMPTTPTSLPPCIPNNPVTTTIPCVPTTTTTAP